MTVRVELTRGRGRASTRWWTARITSTAGLAHLVRLDAPAVEEPGPLTDEHLSVELTARTGAGLRRCADVLFEDRRCEPLEAERTAARALRSYPGCAVAAIGADRELVLLTRTGECVRLPRTAGSRRQLAVLGSLLHAWLAAGGRAADILAPATRPDGHVFEMTSIRRARRSASSAPSP